MRRCCLTLTLILLATPLHAQQFYEPYGEPIPYYTNPGTAIPPQPVPMTTPAPDLPGDVPNAETPPPEIAQEINKYYFSAEYLRWWIKRDSLEQTVVTTATAPTSFGALRQAGTEIVSPGTLDVGGLNGVRATIGVAPDVFFPIELRGFWTRAAHVLTFASDANGTPLFARAILDPVLAQEVAFIATRPGAAAGDIAISGESLYWSAEANILTPQQMVTEDDMPGYVIDFHLGARYLALDEKLEVTSVSRATGAVTFGGNLFAPPSTTHVLDRFRTYNHFIGGQLGSRFDLSVWHFIFGLRSNLALGINQQAVEVFGSSRLDQPDTTPPVSLSLPGGVQAVPSNGGRFSRDVFIVIPEVSATVELPIMNFLRLYAGYDFTYWSDVVRPGREMSRVVDTRQVPTSVNFTPGTVGTQPTTPSFNSTSFWSHGFNVGLALTF